MSLRMGLRPLLVCCALFTISQTAFGQVKVAVINLQKAVFESAEIKKANDDMQATFKPRQDKINQLNTELQTIAQQLQQGAGKLTPQQESDLNYSGQKKQRDVKNLTDDLNADVEAYRNDVLQKSSAKMTDVIKKLAEEKGLDLVVEGSTALYFKPTLDITNDAIAAYDKAYPVKAPAAAPAAK
jgi:outer membrane protein